MPAPSISLTYTRTSKEIAVLENYRNKLSNVNPEYQHFIAEVIFMRLFSVLTACFEDMALKILCSANYRNGISPIIYKSSKSLTDASEQVRRFGRGNKPLRNPTWTNLQSIENNIKHLIDLNEPYYIHIQRSSNIIDEMRIVRNHIAHRTDSTRIKYKQIITQIFGGYRRIQPGALLLSRVITINPKLDYYLSFSKLMIEHISRGY